MNDHAIEEVTQDVETIDQPTQIVIPAVNPTAEDMTGIIEHINVNYNFKVNTKPVNFNFKKTKDKITGIETIRDTVQLAIPYPSVDGIVEILQKGEKGLELLIEAMENVVNTAARDLLSDGPEGHALNAATFPTEKVSWEAIANQPKAQRRGGGIPKETWEAFATDYVEVMPEATGKSIEQVANMAKILVGKLSACRTREVVLNLVVQQLALYAEHSPNIEDYQECVAFLLNKAETFLNVSDEELTANL
jgi:hypothetical protein